MASIGSKPQVSKQVSVSEDLYAAVVEKSSKLVVILNEK